MMNFCEVAARIAGVLGHGCTPDPKEAAECSNFYTLSALMQYVGRKANASDKEAWQHGIEGWNEEAGDRDHPFKLSHTTGTGRLEVVCEDSGRWFTDARTPAKSITLRLVAGGTEQGQVAVAICREREEGWRVVDCRPALFEDRPDRLALLADIDRAIGGEITGDLSPKEGRYYPSEYNEPILAAFAKLLAQKEEEARQEGRDDGCNGAAK